jgi:guanylate kinase
MNSKILTLTGPSGAGKTSIARKLLDLLPNKANMVVSNTTRSRRDSDLKGEYNYLAVREFEDLERNGEFIWATPPYDGNRYGTLRQSVREAATADDSIGIMILTPDVMLTLRSYLSELNTGTKHIPVFVYAPTQMLSTRLACRGQLPDSISARLRQSAKWEESCRSSEIPFYFLRNTRSIDDAVASVMALF